MENIKDIENIEDIEYVEDMQNTENIGFRLSKKQKKELDECVNRLGITRSAFIKFAVSKFIEENKVKKTKK